MSTNIIERVQVKGLFGLYSYNLPKESVFENAAILYGDNGVGKSTLLKLVYHLLSSANNRGHRGALYAADFLYLQVTLSSGVVISAEWINKDEIRFLRLDIRNGNEIIARWNYAKDKNVRTILDEDSIEAFFLKINHIHSKNISVQRSLRLEEDSGIPIGEANYIENLSKHAPVMFMLNADRRLDSDTVADPSDEVEFRRLMRYDAPNSINDLLKRSRDIGLTQALSAASKWISQKAINGTNLGSTNVHSVYTDVVKRIGSPSSRNRGKENKSSATDLAKKLIIIRERIKEHSQYQLATEISVDELVKALEMEKKEKADLAAELLKPYIHSLERKLEAIEPIYEIINTFIGAINNFLNDKKIEFKLGKGFLILNRLGIELDESQLSSGEQQLLLLFCYVITARDRPSIFMIDEPEISLNIKWQRQLIHALLDITKGSEIQFIFASHSMELLSQHRNRVVKLENIVDA